MKEIIPNQIYTEPQKKRYKVVYCIILLNAITWPFCILYKWYAMFFRTIIKFEPGAVKWNICRSISTVCTTCTISLLPGIMKVKRTSTVEREYSKTKKNHKKLITKRIGKAPYLAQYTKIGKVIKSFRTAAFTDLGQWQFVLKLSGHVSFIILNLCVM